MSGLFARFRQGLAKTASRLGNQLAEVLGRRRLDEATLEEIGDILIAADLGPATSEAVVRKLRDQAGAGAGDIHEILRHEIASRLAPLARPWPATSDHRPLVVMMVGVNGAGKTTTIGKLGARHVAAGQRVMFAACDTFRAAAVEQLAIWGRRSGAEVVDGPPGADPGAVAFEAMTRAREQKADVLFIDTAGRLQNRRDLMDSLARLVRICRKTDPAAPHLTLLVLDAGVGQNALSQARTFREVAAIDGLVMTRIDGTARGGVLVALAAEIPLPVYWLGMGEGVDDLMPLDPVAFAEALVGQDPPRGEPAPPQG